MRKSWKISRRTMLRGIGAAMALPLLEVMGPTTARAAATRPPVALQVMQGRTNQTSMLAGSSRAPICGIFFDASIRKFKLIYSAIQNWISIGCANGITS